MSIIRLAALIAIGALSWPLAGQGFVLQTWPEFDFDGAANGSVLAVDLNGDGVPDVVRINGPLGQPGVSLNRRDGRLYDIQAPTRANAVVSRRISVGDLDGDGDVDILFTCWSIPQLPITNLPHVLYLNQGNGTFVIDATGRLPTIISEASGSALGDIDNDGDLDILITNMTGADVLLVNDGVGRFADMSSTLLPPVVLNDHTGVAVFADVDGDGFVDLIRGGWDAPSFLARNDGTGRFVQSNTFGIWRTWDIQVGDIDGNGWPDLYFCGEISGDRLFLNAGHGVFFEATSRLTGLLGPGFGVGSGGAALADFDEDGDLDLVLGTRTSTGTTHVYVGPVLLENDGTGHFINRTLTNMLGLNTTASGFAAADMDGDGDLDVVIAHQGALFVWLEHTVFFNMKRHLRFAPTAQAGATQHLETYADAGHAMIPVLSLAESWLPAGEFGMLAIDTVGSAVLPWTVFATTGRIDVPLPIPANQALVGLRIFAQGLDLWNDASGAHGRLTNRTNFVIR